MRRGYKGPARTLSQQGPQGRERREHQEGCNGWKWLIAVLDGGKHSMARSWGETSGAWWETLGGARDRGRQGGSTARGGKGKARAEEWGEGCWQCGLVKRPTANDKNYTMMLVCRKSTTTARKLFHQKADQKVQGREAPERGSNNQL